MDKNTWIGFLLIAGIIVGFSMLSRPSKEEIAERQRINDSIAAVQIMEAQAQQIQEALDNPTATPTAEPKVTPNDLAALYGPFAPAAEGQATIIELENEVLRLYVSTYGGRIVRAELKEYKTYGDSINPLCLFGEEESQLGFTLTTNNQRVITTDRLYFEPLRTADSVLTMRLHTSTEDSYIDFVYTLRADYEVDFTIAPHNAASVLARNVNALDLHWYQIIPQQERGRKFEERYAQLQYMLVGGEMEKLSETKHDYQSENSRIRWIGYKDQFFSTVLVANEAFSTTKMESMPQPAASGYIKAYDTKTSVPFNVQQDSPVPFRFFFVPNNYNILKAYDNDLDADQKLNLKELVPLGWKIVSWINKILVIPMFDIFMSWGLHIGLVILLMTLVIKIIILPFVFASYKSSAKMRVLKPQIDEINAKYPPEKMQERQKETMALYSRAGVSPMSGCLPMLFQFPVLMAMFWFFPTAIELRGQSFLWAEDLSTYDAILTWSNPIPLFGTHLSLFCLLMTAVNIIYTYITMQQQATDPNMKFMKYMMYAMPLMFLFIFNDYAAGLSYYYFLSLLLTIIQTMIFRWSIDDKKLLAEMEANAKKRAANPQKSGFMARLEKMQQEQQRMAREQAKAQSKKIR